MDDRREAILVYLQTLLRSVPNIVEVYRDRGDLVNFQLPSIVLLDGREQLLTKITGQSLVSMPPAVFRLSPDILLFATPRDDQSNLTLNQAPAPIGPELSMWRGAVIKAITTDINLVAMLGTNGQVEYNGCETDMAEDNTLQGRLFFHFSFSYVLDPAKL